MNASLSGHVHVDLLYVPLYQPLLHLHHRDLSAQTEKLPDKLCNIPSHLRLDHWDLPRPGCSPQILCSLTVRSKLYLHPVLLEDPGVTRVAPAIWS